MSAAEISSLFVFWSLTGIVLEVPSGVLADATSRRRLLVAAPLLAGAGFGIWTFAPSYPAFAIGFVLWGAQGALQSGAFEALLYEELDRLGAADSYARVYGRATAATTAAAALATGLAAPVFAAGGFAAVGIASIATCVAAAAVAATLPEHRDAGEAEGEGAGAGFRAVLGAGVTAIRSSADVRRGVLVVALVTAIWGALDEYLPLLAVEGGAAPRDVPLLALLVYLGMTAGGVAGGAAGALPRGGIGALLAVAAGLLAAGATLGGPAGFALIALAFCGFQAATVAVDARLQDSIDGPARSTITSGAGLATDLLTIGVFAAYGAGSAAAGHAALFAAFAALYAAPVLLLAGAHRRLRARRPRP